jgi:predicted amidophosphoribosyltransferase
MARRRLHSPHPPGRGRLLSVEESSFAASAAGKVLEASADRFALAAHSPVQDRHILLIEDTWVSGGNAQSATLTLRSGGAASVTIRRSRAG